MAIVYWAHLKDHTDPKTQGYIGITSQSLKKRMSGHLNDSNSKSDLIFHKAIRKYGFDNIVFDKLHEGDIEFIRLVEWMYRSNPRVGWNVAIGGGEVMTGRKHSVETKAKISKANTGKLRLGTAHTEESKRKLSLAATGRKASPEVREKMSLQRKGKKGHPHSEAAKMKMSLAKQGDKSVWYGTKHSSEAKSKMAKARTLYMRNASPETWILAESVYDFMKNNLEVTDSFVAKSLNLQRSKIRRMCINIKSGWNPYLDDEYQEWKNNKLTEVSNES